MRKISLFILFAAAALRGSMAYGQVNKVPGKPFVLGVVNEINSKQLSEKRILNIYLPDGYEKDTAHYPVIYLLDGSANEDYIHVVGIVQFMNMLGLMPNTIVVGIANVDRKRDFTFPTTIDSDRITFPTTGHSAKFISFIEKELQPFIEKNYRVNGSKMLIGQSLGGLLATEILLKKQALFNRYLIVSPSLWWDGASLLKQMGSLLSPQPDRDIDITVLTGGKEEDVMRTDASQLAENLHKFGKPHYHIYYKEMKEESHLTILHNAVYQILMRQNGHTKEDK